MVEWRPVPDYEGLYEVNSVGQVRSQHQRYKDVELLRQGISSKGYNLVSLCKDGKQKTLNVHRLVALAFIPNPQSLPCVNHKDEDKTNNSVSNLEWCTYAYNNTYGNRLIKSASKRGIPVSCVETGIVYPSAHAAHRATGISQSSICMCCKGRLKTAGHLHWSYV